MDNKKRLEVSGPFAGLWVRTAKALRRAGYTSREEILADLTAGRLHPYLSVTDYGRKADAEVRQWLGLKSWDECYLNATAADIFRTVRRRKRSEESRVSKTS